MAKHVKKRRKVINRRRHLSADEKAQFAFFIAEISRRGKLTGKFLVDRNRVHPEDTTGQPDLARRFKGRNGSFQFFHRQPDMAKRFTTVKLPIGK